MRSNKNKENYLMFIDCLSKTSDRQRIKDYYRIYIEYQKELEQIANEKFNMPAYKQIENDILNRYDDGLRHALLMVGKRIVGIVRYQDVYWENFFAFLDIYILPEFRHQGYGTRALRGIFACMDKKTPIFLCILKNNEIGRCFWNNAEKAIKMAQITNEKLLEVILRCWNGNLEDCEKRIYVLK